MAPIKIKMFFHPLAVKFRTIPKLVRDSNVTVIIKSKFDVRFSIVIPFLESNASYRAVHVVRFVSLAVPHK